MLLCGAANPGCRRLSAGAPVERTVGTRKRQRRRGRRDCPTVAMPANPWPNLAGLPRGAAAALAALHFRNPALEELQRLTDAEWRDALNFTILPQLTLPLRASPARDSMPPWAQERTDACTARNLERLHRVEALYRALDAQLRAAGIEYLALKGMAHCPEFCATAAGRVQYDIDLYTPQECAHAARDAVVALGFEPMESMERFPTDHLPALIRKTGWEWRGDFFDPEIPIAAEIHFQFWNQRIERLRAPGVEEFWPRRVRREVPECRWAGFPRWMPLGFASLHLAEDTWCKAARGLPIYTRWRISSKPMRIPKPVQTRPNSGPSGARCTAPSSGRWKLPCSAWRASGSDATPGPSRKRR